jgi:hypothetical protein
VRQFTAEKSEKVKENEKSQEKKGPLFAEPGPLFTDNRISVFAPFSESLLLR